MIFELASVFDTVVDNFPELLVFARELAGIAVVDEFEYQLV